MKLCHVGVCSVWDWEQGSRLSAFSARNPRHTRITYSEFINAHDQALLVTGSGSSLLLFSVLNTTILLSYSTNIVSNTPIAVLEIT